MSSKEASAILDSVHKKTKVFGCNLENYLKVSFKITSLLVVDLRGSNYFMNVLVHTYIHTYSVHTLFVPNGLFRIKS